MTDVINGKNKKRCASSKMVLPIFTQYLSGGTEALFRINLFPQQEAWFDDFIQINLL